MQSIKKGVCPQDKRLFDISVPDYLVAVVSIATVVESVDIAVESATISITSPSTSIAALFAELPAQEAKTNDEQIVAKVKICFMFF